MADNMTNAEISMITGAEIEMDIIAELTDKLKQMEAERDKKFELYEAAYAKAFDEAINHFTSVNGWDEINQEVIRWRNEPASQKLLAAVCYGMVACVEEIKAWDWSVGSYDPDERIEELGKFIRHDFHKIDHIDDEELFVEHRMAALIEEIKHQINAVNAYMAHIKKDIDDVEARIAEAQAKVDELAE